MVRFDEFLKTTLNSLKPVKAQIVTLEQAQNTGYLKEAFLQAQLSNIKLIQLFEHEWKNRNSQCISFLKSAFGLNSRIIYARKCVLKEVEKKEAADFLNTYHILGKVGFKVALGLYLGEELVCLASFSQHHRKSQELVLNRFVGKLDCNVVGGLSKLCNEAYKRMGAFKTWVDLRMSNGVGWEKAGWKIEEVMRPDYFYFNPDTGYIISKQSRKKSAVNTPREMTELQHAVMEGLIRVWDAGKVRLVYQRGSAKRCLKCQLEKSKEHFNKDRSKRDQLHIHCKTCQRAISKKVYQERKHLVKNRYEQNKEEILSKRKEYRKLNKEKIKAAIKKHYEKNKEKIHAQQKEYRRQWRETNQLHIKDWAKDYHQKNKPRIYKYRSNRIKTDIQTKIKNRMRCRLRAAIRNQQKRGSAIQDLGISVADFMKYLETKFYTHSITGEPMAWENYGKWHIDHIIPLSAFDLTKEEEVLKAVHYTNLQPLWAEENFKKNAKGIKAKPLDRGQFADI